MRVQRPTQIDGLLLNSAPPAVLTNVHDVRCSPRLCTFGGICELSKVALAGRAELKGLGR